MLCLYLLIADEIADRTDETGIPAGRLKDRAEHESGSSLALCAGYAEDLKFFLGMTVKCGCGDSQSLLCVLSLDYDTVRSLYGLNEGIIVIAFT